MWFFGYDDHSWFGSIIFFICTAHCFLCFLLSFQLINDKPRCLDSKLSFSCILQEWFHEIIYFFKVKRMVIIFIDELQHVSMLIRVLCCLRMIKSVLFLMSFYGRISIMAKLPGLVLWLRCLLLLTGVYYRLDRRFQVRIVKFYSQKTKNCHKVYRRLKNKSPCFWIFLTFSRSSCFYSSVEGVYEREYHSIPT